LLASYHPALELIGVSTVYGNASLDRTTRNALSVLEAIGKSEICVYPGASKPFCRVAHHAPEIHGVQQRLAALAYADSTSGESGLDGTDLLPLPSRKPVTHCNAIKDMKEALLAYPPNTAWLVATGALTNVALLFATFPEVASHLRGLSIMGGAVGNGFTNVPLGPSFTNSSGEVQARIGNHTPYAEFNIWCDPESAQSVFRNPILQSKTVLIPLDVTHQAFATKVEQEMVLHGTFGRRTCPSNVRQMYHDLLMFFAKTYADVFGLEDGPPLHDPLAVAVLVHDCSDASTRVKFDDNGGERWDVQVELAGDEIGRTRISPAKEGILIPRTLDLKHFWKVINECLDMIDEKLAGEQ
jgi:uridine nucleosidase